MQEARSHYTDSSEIFSVAELSARIKLTLSEEFGRVQVRGEVTGYRGVHTSGHCYFGIKDDAVRIDAVMWRQRAAKYAGIIEDGLEVLVTASVTTWAASSRYQLVVEHIEPAGVGALMALLMKRKQKLTAEGLFDADIKQLPPPYPRVIGVVTSPTGAVIRDIIHRLRARFPVKLLLWSVRVQGEGSAAEVAAAIDGFERMAQHAREGLGARVEVPEVLIIARGGGSIEDLWGFNDEEVVRAAARCSIPLISAVGHETDWTLLDLAADIRAPTPTAAAELAVPDRAELITRIEEIGIRLAREWLTSRQRLRGALAATAGRIVRGGYALGQYHQGLDTASRRLTDTINIRMSDLRRRLRGGALRSQKTALRANISGSRARAGELARALQREIQHRLAKAGAAVKSLARMNESLSHKATLERGFAIVQQEGSDGSPAVVPRKAMLANAAPVTIRFSDGEVAAALSAGEVTPPQTKHRKRGVTVKGRDAKDAKGRGVPKTELAQTKLF